MEGEQPSGVTPDSPTGGSPAGDGQVQPTGQPTGGEAVTSSGDGQQEQAVPFHRFQEVNDAKRKAEERAQAVEQELAAIRAADESKGSQTGDDEIDPDVEALISKTIKKLGYVSKDELAQDRAAQQYQLDTQALTDQYKNSGVPFDANAVREYAKENGLPITNKTSMEAAFKQMNWGKFMELERNRAVTEFKENGSKTSGEIPGPGGARQPEQPEAHGVKSRIAAARQKLSV